MLQDTLADIVYHDVIIINDLMCDKRIDVIEYLLDNYEKCLEYYSEKDLLELYKNILYYGSAYNLLYLIKRVIGEGFVVLNMDRDFTISCMVNCIKYGNVDILKYFVSKTDITVSELVDHITTYGCLVGKKCIVEYFLENGIDYFSMICSSMSEYEFKYDERDEN